MGKMVLLNARTFAGATDLTGVSNKSEIAMQADAVDVTNFGGAGWEEVLAGRIDVDIAVGGFFESGSDLSFADPALFAGMGAVGPWTMAPAGAADGAVAYVTNALQAAYNPVQGNIGDAGKFEATAKGTTKLARGVIAHPPGTARIANGTGTAVQLGALATPPAVLSALYVNLHVLSIAGTGTPTITARVESDDNAGFTSPTTRGTFTAATALGGQHMKIAGPVTDDWWRIAWTITGTGPSFLFVASFGRA